MLNKDRIIIKIQHVNKSYLNSLVQQILFIIEKNYFSSLTIKSISLPKKTKKITVLKSPHVSKKAREQFSQVIHTKLILLRFIEDNKKSNFLYVLKNKLMLLNCKIKITY